LVALFQGSLGNVAQRQLIIKIGSTHEIYPYFRPMKRENKVRMRLNKMERMMEVAKGMKQVMFFP
jgi:hypothetical protein